MWRALSVRPDLGRRVSFRGQALAGEHAHEAGHEVGAGALALDLQVVIDVERDGAGRPRQRAVAP